MRQGHLEQDFAGDYVDFLKLSGKKNKIMVVAGARLCHYFTLPIKIPLIPEECKFFNRTKSFLTIPA